MEMRDSDAADAKPLKVFYTRPSLLQPAFDTWFNTAVAHHDSSPTFLDEVSHDSPSWNFWVGKDVALC